MAGLNLLASLLGAPATDDAGGGVGDGDEGAGGDAKGRGGQRDSFKINLFPDDPFDGAQAKDGDDDEVCVCTCVRVCVCNTICCSLLACPWVCTIL